MNSRKSKVFARFAVAAIGRLAIATVLVLGAACSNDTTSGFPAPVAPPWGTDQPLPSVPPGRDPRLPQLLDEKVVEIFLADGYQGLGEIAGASGDIILFPMVETLFRMQINGGRSSTPSGQLLLGFEDSEGFWGAVLNSFQGTGLRTTSGTTTSVDMIFSDSKISVRVTANKIEDDFTGNIYYRVRQSGETACQSRTITCFRTTYQWVWNQQNRQWQLQENQEPVACTEAQKQEAGVLPAQQATTCRSYMNIGASKLLGSFQTKYSHWANE